MNKKKDNSGPPSSAAIPRPPVVAIMGHIDHGKSTLLDYIRRSNVVAAEHGGITQHLGAYEIARPSGEGGPPRRITFLDTPGHAAFLGIRARSAQVADVAILIVSGEEGVKPQTVEALRCINESGVPYVVAITKIDSERCDVERTRASLAEHEIYVEGYGGGISSVPVSGKTGEGIPELIDLVLLTSDLAHATTDPSLPASGIVIEANCDSRRGNATTMIIKDGTLKKGSWLVAGGEAVPVRFIENDRGAQIDSATASSPVRIVGWPSLPPVGSPVSMYPDRKSAEKAAAEALARTETAEHGQKKQESAAEGEVPKIVIPIIVKADVGGSAEAIVQEISKAQHPRAEILLVGSGVGEITENDVKLARSRTGTVILAFGVPIRKQVADMAEREKIEIQHFDLIYKLTEAVDALLAARAPKEIIEESNGRARILAVFKADKDRQIVGGRVEEGALPAGASVKLFRRDAEIGRGKIRSLEQNKQKAESVKKGAEFGAMIEARLAIVVGDVIESFTTSER